MTMGESWEVSVTGGGLWPCRWNWKVNHWQPGYVLDVRTGACRTKEKAHRKAVKAQVAMGREDFHLEEAS
jgi:hypothetical protein